MFALFLTTNTMLIGYIPGYLYILQFKNIATNTNCKVVLSVVIYITSCRNFYECDLMIKDSKEKKNT